MILYMGLRKQREEAEYTAGSQPHDDAAGDHFQRDGAESRAEFHLQQGGDEAAGPGTGSGQGNGYQNRKSPSIS